MKGNGRSRRTDVLLFGIIFLIKSLISHLHETSLETSLLLIIVEHYFWDEENVSSWVYEMRCNQRLLKQESLVLDCLALSCVRAMFLSTPFIARKELKRESVCSCLQDNMEVTSTYSILRQSSWSCCFVSYLQAVLEVERTRQPNDLVVNVVSDSVDSRSDNKQTLTMQVIIRSTVVMQINWHSVF